MGVGEDAGLPYRATKQHTLFLLSAKLRVRCGRQNNLSCSAKKASPLRSLLLPLLRKAETLVGLTSDGWPHEEA